MKRDKAMEELSDRAEEILEHLWIRLEEHKESVDMGALRDADEFRSLQTLELVVTTEQGTELTEQGRRQARQCIRRHRLAERLLHDILDSSDADLHAVGCKFEHGLHRELEEKVCTILGHPKVCPHGKPIPQGKCCRRLKREAGPLITTLAEIPAGERAVVAYLHSEEVSDLRKLMAIGILPGTQLVLLQRFPSYLLEIGHSQFAIDKDMARQVYVRHQAQ